MIRKQLKYIYRTKLIANVSIWNFGFNLSPLHTKVIYKLIFEEDSNTESKSLQLILLGKYFNCFQIICYRLIKIYNI